MRLTTPYTTPASGVHRPDVPDNIVATDGELLARFVRHADDCAFAQIVERHGRLVWLVCREMLRHHQDVEDAFQATFLILSQRASSIHSSDSAAAWLHRVAQRTALAARRKRAKLREQELTSEPEDDNYPALSQRELIYVLLDELRKLPDRYQVPLVLRYFERLSRQAIAEQTDSSVPQIQGRLVRGRRMLRSRMLQRGASLSLATGAVAAVSNEAGAKITSAIAATMAKRCLACKKSGDITGVTPMALWLANQGAKAMWITSIFKTAATISAVLLVAGITWAVEGGGGGSNALPSATVGTKTDLAVVKPQADATKGATQPTPTSANAFADELDRKASNLQDELFGNSIDKANVSAELELLQLQKARIQRELEVVNDAFGPFKPESDSADETTRKNVAALEKQSLALQNEFKNVGREIAEKTATVERHQRKLKRAQELLDNIDRLRSQLDMQRILESAKASSAPSAAPPSADYRIQPEDALTVQTLSNTYPPINDSYYVEPMGTIALGPANGRVKVEGLTILEAEQAIKKKLSEVNGDATGSENLKVQATLSAKRAAPQPTPNEPWRQASQDVVSAPSKSEPQQLQIIQQLQRESELLQKENAELKRKVDQLHNPPSKVAGSSSRYIRQGDEFLVRRTVKSGQNGAMRAAVEEDGTLRLFEPPALKVQGLTELKAKEAIQKALRLNNSDARVEVDVIPSGE